MCVDVLVRGLFAVTCATAWKIFTENWTLILVGSPGEITV